MCHDCANDYRLRILYSKHAALRKKALALMLQTATIPFALSLPPPPPSGPRAGAATLLCKYLSICPSSGGLSHMMSVDFVLFWSPFTLPYTKEKKCINLDHLRLTGL